MSDLIAKLSASAGDEYSTYLFAKNLLFALDDKFVYIITLLQIDRVHSLQFR